MAVGQTRLATFFANIIILLVTSISSFGAVDASLLPQALTRRADNTNLDPNRQPALYTENFGDCLGGSLLDITRFDAAYYADNSTVVFHLQGTSTVSGIMLMMQIGVFAYGESRFNLLFNPCNANIYSLCPTNTSIPIEASGLIPVSESDVSGIPPIALSIPDFEGQAILRIFSNATESEIGCYSAVVSNGNSFAHANVIAPIVGLFTFAALVASFAAAIYGDSVTTIRTHYAHSLSIFVVFSVFHHIFYTGALSMNWPSVLPAFWSNFAWASGMIYSKQMMNSINKILGVNLGNTTVVGAANLGASSDGTGGGYQISEVYKRSSDLVGHVFGREPATYSDIVDMFAFQRHTSRELTKRALENSTTGFDWYGVPVNLGLPLPGNYSGFAGTLAAEGIPASNAFLTGFLWFLIILAIILSSVIAFKWSLELLIKVGWVSKSKLPLFRRYWIGYTALAGARTFFIAFFMMMFLSMFQFVYKGSTGIIAVATLVFIIFFLGLLSIAALACFYRLRFGRYRTVPDRIHLERTRAFGAVPWYGFKRQHLREKEDAAPSLASLPWWRVQYEDEDPQRISAHDDVAFVKRYGWLSARFRRTRWWFFSVWLLYEFIRACFYGGAAGHPMVQVFGLLAVEIIAFVALIKIKPFEANRLNALMVYLLGFSKVACVALSSAFIAEFNIPRIEATVIAVVIIVIQGFLLLALLVFIVLGAMATRMSLTRNREVDPYSEDWGKLRERYFNHLNEASTDKRKREQATASEPLKRPKKAHQNSSFAVSSIRRMPKIEDHDDEDAHQFDPYGSRISLAENQVATPSNRRVSRAVSIQSTMSHSNLPFGARPHRASWSSRDFHGFNDSQRNSGIGTSSGSKPIELRNMRSDTSLRDGYMIQPANRPISRPKSGPIEMKRSRASTMLAPSKELHRVVSVEESPRTNDDDEIGVAQ